MKTVVAYFDVVSSASYLAWTQMPRIAQEASAQIEWRPILLGGLFRTTGNVSPISVPAKAAYIVRDFKRFADRYGVPFVPTPFPLTNTAGVMRMILGVQATHPAKRDAFISALFRAMWVEEKDLGDASVVSTIAAACALDPSAMVAMANDPALKDRLRANTDEAAARGAFGAPTFFVGEEMFFGQDRLDFVRAALTEVRA